MFRNFGIYKTKSGWAWQRTSPDGDTASGKGNTVADCLQAVGVPLQAAPASNPGEVADLVAVNNKLRCQYGVACADLKQANLTLEARGADLIALRARLEAQGATILRLSDTPAASGDLYQGGDATHWHGEYARMLDLADREIHARESAERDASKARESAEFWRATAERLMPADEAPAPVPPAQADTGPTATVTPIRKGKVAPAPATSASGDADPVGAHLDALEAQNV